MRRSIYNTSLFAEHLIGFGDLKTRIMRYRQKQESGYLKERKKRDGLIEIERIVIDDSRKLQDVKLGPYPLVFDGVASDWKCCKNWNFTFIQHNYGDDKAFVLYTETDTGEMLYEEITMRDAIDRMVDDPSVNLRFQPLLQRHPELVEDLDVTFYNTLIPRGAMNSNKQFFMAGNGAFTPIHTAIQSLLFLQVYGEKEWIVYHPRDTIGLSPKIERTPYFFSDFHPIRDGEKGDNKALQGYRTVLKPGDVLYLPSFWWHFVRNLSDCISVGFRWTTLGGAARASFTLSMLTLMSANPPIWTTIRDKADFSKVVLKRKKIGRVEKH